MLIENPGTRMSSKPTEFIGIGGGVAPRDEREGSHP